ncbi:hypothetical protein SDJN02_13138, partial [Cucurbita argyrosperma subsp. argyrosperma]
MEAALGNSKDYSLKQYLSFAKKLQDKAKGFVEYGNRGKGEGFAITIRSQEWRQNRLQKKEENLISAGPSEGA